MIHFRCTSCHRPLEVDDELANKKVACPHCNEVNVARASQRATASGVPYARPRAAVGRVSPNAAPETDDDASPAETITVESDRATALGLPPDSGPEQDVLTLHPAMGRARPLWGIGLGTLLAAGLVTLGYGIYTIQTVGTPWLYAGGVLLVLAGIWWVVWKVQCMTIALIITNKRTTLRRGILRRETKEILHDKVQDLQIRQSFLERMCKVGAIGISSAGESGVEIQVDNMPDPIRVREIIDAYREIG